MPIKLINMILQWQLDKSTIPSSIHCLCLIVLYQLSSASALVLTASKNYKVLIHACLFLPSVAIILVTTNYVMKARRRMNGKIGM